MNWGATLDRHQEDPRRLLTGGTSMEHGAGVEGHETSPGLGPAESHSVAYACTVLLRPHYYYVCRTNLVRIPTVPASPPSYLAIPSSHHLCRPSRSYYYYNAPPREITGRRTEESGLHTW